MSTACSILLHATTGRRLCVPDLPMPFANRPHTTLSPYRRYISQDDCLGRSELSMYYCRYIPPSVLIVLLVVFASACASGSSSGSQDGAERLPDSYLETTTPPCTPAGPSSKDPCKPRSSYSSVDSPPTGYPAHLPLVLPTFTEIFMGEIVSSLDIPHIVVRGVIQDSSTRCDGYAVVGPDYIDLSGLDVEEFSVYHCFVDLAVNEYIIGTGPATLTVSMYEATIWIDPHEWPDIEQEYLHPYGDPRTLTADAYEGREMVLLLKPNASIAVEVWTSFGLMASWFVQRDGAEDIRAVAEQITLAQTEEHRNQLNVPLDDLVADISAAATARDAHIAASETTTTTDGAESRSAESTSTSSGTSTTTTTGAGLLRPVGGLGDSQPLPVLITDANRLRDFYVEVGAVYEGEEATTVLPPPRPEAPGVPTNVGMSMGDDGRILDHVG